MGKLALSLLLKKQWPVDCFVGRFLYRSGRLYKGAATRLFTLDVVFADHGSPRPHLRRQEAPQAIGAANIKLDLQRFGQLPVDGWIAQRSASALPKRSLTSF